MKSGKADDIEVGNNGHNEFSDDDEDADGKGGEVEGMEDDRSDDEGCTWKKMD